VWGGGGGTARFCTQGKSSASAVTTAENISLQRKSETGKAGSNRERRFVICKILETLGLQIVGPIRF
jgi:hypothetical protein